MNCVELFLCVPIEETCDRYDVLYVVLILSCFHNDMFIDR